MLIREKNIKKLFIPLLEFNTYNFRRWLMKKGGVAGVLSVIINIATIVGLKVFFIKYFFEIKKYLNQNKLEVFKKAGEDEIKRYHFNTNLRMHISSSLISKDLLFDYFHVMGIYSYQDMSNIIFIAFHRFQNIRGRQIKKEIKLHIINMLTII